MYGNQPLSRTGCKNQLYRRCGGYYLSDQVLIRSFLVLVCLFLALPASAEQKYYTWVDAQGNIHNTLITPEKSASEQTDAEQEATNPEATKQKDAAGINPDDYPSEEQYQKNLENKLNTEKPFYTWTDAEGIIRSEVKPEVVIEFSATEIVYDVALVPPFRLPEYVRNGICCEAYAEHFTAEVEPNGSGSFKVDNSQKAFKTQQGEVNAAYFSLAKLSAKEIVVIKAYQIPKDSEFELIALSESFKPLYLQSNIKGMFVPETWKDVAYKKVMVELSDTEVKHLIIFIKDPQGIKGHQSRAEGSYTVSVIRDTLNTK